MHACRGLNLCWTNKDTVNYKKPITTSRHFRIIKYRRNRSLQYVSFLFLYRTKCQVKLHCVSLMLCRVWAITHCSQNMTLDLFPNHYSPLVYDIQIILWAAFVSIKCQLEKSICTHLQPTVYFSEMSAARLVICTLTLSVDSVAQEKDTCFARCAHLAGIVASLIRRVYNTYIWQHKVVK